MRARGGSGQRAWNSVGKRASCVASRHLTRYRSLGASKHAGQFSGTIGSCDASEKASASVSRT
eukprot:6793754-Prymnesium_polylepis.1